MATCCLLLLLASARWRNMLRLGASAAVAHARMRCAALRCAASAHSTLHLQRRRRQRQQQRRRAVRHRASISATRDSNLTQKQMANNSGSSSDGSSKRKLPAARCAEWLCVRVCVSLQRSVLPKPLATAGAAAATLLCTSTSTSARSRSLDCFGSARLFGCFGIALARAIGCALLLLHPHLLPACLSVPPCLARSLCCCSLSLSLSLSLCVALSGVAACVVALPLRRCRLRSALGFSLFIQPTDTVCGHYFPKRSQPHNTHTLTRARTHTHTRTSSHSHTHTDTHVQ